LWRLYLHINLNGFFIWNKKFIEFLQTFFYCFLKILLDLVFYTFGFRYQDKRLCQLFLSHLIDLYMYTTIRCWCWSSCILQAKETKAHFYTAVSRVTGNCFYQPIFTIHTNTGIQIVWLIKIRWLRQVPVSQCSPRPVKICSDQ
jgi:hypothetical protein